MNIDEVKRLVQVSVAGAVIIGLLYISYKNATLLSPDAFRGFGFGLNALLAFWLFYFRWGWRMPVLRLLFSKPNLNGTWIGKLKTDWGSERGIEVHPREFVVVIRQSFLTLHVTTFTDSFIALSYAETLWKDDDRGIARLAFLYAQDSTTVGAGGNREGVTELSFIGSKPPQLKGRYWSNTKTRGFITLTRIAKVHAQTFEDALKLRMSKED